MSWKAVLALVMAVLAAVSVPLAADGAEADGEVPYVLIDMGDGDTYWAPASGSTVEERLSRAAAAVGLEADISAMSVGGKQVSSIGDIAVGWRYYVWSDGAWADSTASLDLGAAAPSADVALGYYPEGTVPTETPSEKESWTMVRGNASQDAVQSANLGSDGGMASVAAVNKGKLNYVTGCVLVARGCVFAFYNGGYMNTQSTPSLVCFDRYTGEERWSMDVPAGVGYETQTGCIVGDYYYLPTSYGFIYKVPLAGPGDVSYSLDLSSRLVYDSTKDDKGVALRTPLIDSVQYRISGDGEYVDAERIDMDTDCFSIPAEIGRTYDVRLTASSVSKVFDVKALVNTADALGVKLYGFTDDDESDNVAVVGDTSLRLRHVYSDVERTYLSTSNADVEQSTITYSTGAASMVYSDGAIYFGSSNGHVYAMDLGLNVIWDTVTKGQHYHDSVTVKDGLVYEGNYAGYLNVIDAATGKVLASAKAAEFTSEAYGTNGRVCAPMVVGDTVYVGISDGLGMNSTQAGIAAYKYSDGALTQVFAKTDLTAVSEYLIPVSTDGFQGVYFVSNEGFSRMTQDGTIEVLNPDFPNIHCSLVLVNGTEFGAQEYPFDKGAYGGRAFLTDMDGNIVSIYKRPSEVDGWCMSPLVFIGDYLYAGTDNGFYIAKGQMDPAPSGSDHEGAGLGPVEMGAIIVVVAFAAFLAVCAVLAKRRGEKTAAYIGRRFYELSGFRNDSISKTRANKRRLVFVLVVGVIALVAMFLASICYGPSGTFSPWDAVGHLSSAIGKHGNGLTLEEVVVYESRLPRAIAAVAVGLGLAVAGCIYQAVIRNPLVDPYIMGVSSGAGTFAVAAIATGFTMWGLLDNSDYAVPILAIVGGILAFSLTMLIAMKAGGSATGYVLAGVVIGLAFSSIQTVMLVTSDSDRLHNAISWLYGSFTAVDWNTVWLVFFPALFLSLASLLWAKELNLVLLGEEEAQQMGLNVKRFNAFMLILASVLTSVCVAFVGIIGFVGLVVPHLCRMVLGGDHRLVLPASMVIGAALMLLADLLARMIMVPQELPVGAVTTVIGVPVFAYLLVRRGRMYEG